MGACEPGQVRKEAALSGYFHVPRGCPPLRSYREITQGLSRCGSPFSFVYNLAFIGYNNYVCEDTHAERRDGDGLFSFVPSVAAAEF